jgi:DNA invertase Pin-like site-specific DNA recombinase
MPTVGYIRVSTEDQVKEGVSLENQKSKIQTYCELKDLDLIEIIEDAGISAKNLRRPGVQKVLRLAQKKKVDAVVVYKLDRIFRSTVDALETTRMFDKWGISFHSIEETLDTQSAMGRFFFTLTAALAEMERRIIGERTKAALAHKRSKRESIGGYAPPYGYDLDDTGHLIRNDVEQRGIKLIKSLHMRGDSLRVICQELRANGYRTKTGKDEWNPKTVSMILKRTIRDI